MGVHFYQIGSKASIYTALSIARIITVVMEGSIYVYI